MSKSIEKLQALKLRRQGWSIKDIAKELQVSRGSASLWCQGIQLTSLQKEKLKAKQIAAGSAGRQKGAEMNRKKRVDAIDEAGSWAEQKIKEVRRSNLFFLGIGIYWGEGVKSRSGQAAVVNSDSRILKVMIRWFEECLQLSRSDFRPYVYIASQHKSREQIIMKYWENELAIPREQFKSPIYLEQRPKQRYENHDNYFGVVALRVVKSTNLKYRILALLKIVSKRLE
ncbi:MAG: hypothetical protein RLZZ70_800 [Candidatus Parcubacteria bacterium]|jgi:transcriptional regulator with XRE-family HTH domain